MAIILRAPLLTPPARSRGVQVDVWPNLLLSTLAVVTAVAPFNPTDATPARARQPQTQDTNVQNVLIRNLPPAQLLPVGLNGRPEWYLARPRVSGQDTAYENPILLRTLVAPVIPVDTTQRIKPTAQQDTNPVNRLMFLLAPGVFVPPFLPIDRSQWRKPIAPQDTNPAPSLLAILTPAQLSPIGANGSERWNQPRVRVNGQDWQAANLLTNTLAVAATAPLLPVDFGQSARQRGAQDTNAANLLLLLSPVIVTPCDTGAWTRANTHQDTNPVNQLMRLLPPGMAAPPIVPIDRPQWRKPISPQDTSVPQSIIYQTVFAPIVPVDTTQRIKPVSPQDTNPVNQLMRLLPPGAPPPPFVPVDWSQWKKPTAPQDTSIPQSMIYQTVFPPLRPVDALQISRRTGIQADAQAYPLVLLTPPVLAPLLPVMMDQFARRAGAQSDATANRLILQGVVSPVAPLDFTQAVRRVSAQVEQPLNLLFSTLAIVPSPFPVASRDIGVISRRAPAQDAISPNVALYTLTPIPQFPPIAPEILPLTGYGRRIQLSGGPAVMSLTFNGQRIE